MPRAYFVTATDTGVGKTTVSAGILASLRRRGHTVHALKPVETGCVRASDGTLVPDDGLLLAAALGLDERAATNIAPLRFTTPVAPAVAARLEPNAHPRYDADVVNTHVSTALAARADLILVEGAGGLLVPFTDDTLAADLARTHALPLLVVARASLGTISHTLLTLREARRLGLVVAGVILNRVVELRGADEDTNADELRRLAPGVPILGTVPHVAAGRRRDTDALADAVDAAFDPRALL